MTYEDVMYLLMDIDYRKPTVRQLLIESIAEDKTIIDVTEWLASYSFSSDAVHNQTIFEKIAKRKKIQRLYERKELLRLWADLDTPPRVDRDRPFKLNLRLNISKREQGACV